MKRFWPFLTPAAMVLGITLAPFVLSGCGEEKATVPESVGQQSAESQLLTLEFTYPMTFSELSELASIHQLTVEEIRLKFDGFTCGYTVGGRDLHLLEGDFYEKHIAFLKLLNDRAHNTINPNTLTEDLGKYLQEAIAHDVPIRLVTFQNPDEIVLAQQLSAIVRSDVAVMPVGIQEESAFEGQQEQEGPHAAPQSYYHERWAPCRGWSKVTQGMTYQEFWFNDVRDFYDGSTYEHETQIYNPNFADYANYWSSNLPYPYLDSRFGDDPNYENYVVGSFLAHLIVREAKYWTYIALRPGSQNSGTTKIRGQWGYRFPYNCYHPYCVYASATTYPGHLAYLALPNYGVNWTY